MVDNFAEAIIRAKDSMLNSNPTCTPPIFYTAGTGISDELAVEYYKHTNQYIMTRDGTLWQRGKIVEEK